MIQHVAIVGNDRIAYLAALSLMRAGLGVTMVDPPGALPRLSGDSEGTLPSLPNFLHGALCLDEAMFLRNIAPIWMLGTRLHWGPRPFFDLTYAEQIHTLHPGLGKQTGYFAHETDWSRIGVASALMTQDRVLLNGNGNGVARPAVPYGYQLDLDRLEPALRDLVGRSGARWAPAPLAAAEQDEHGITKLILADGHAFSADLYIDVTGPGAALAGIAFERPVKPFAATLPCDRIITARRERGKREEIHPCRTIQTRNAGWSWRGEQIGRVDCGYAYSSRFISDDQAMEELWGAEGELMDVRGYAITPGWRESWVKNVVALGEASAILEPLASVSLSLAASQIGWLIGVLNTSDRNPPEAAKEQYNRLFARTYEAAAQFQAVCYKYNTKLEAPFWNECRATVSIGDAQIFVDHYQQVGPTGIYAKSLLDVLDPFGREAYLSALVGMKVPFARPYEIDEPQRTAWRDRQQLMWDQAMKGTRLSDALRMIQQP